MKVRQRERNRETKHRHHEFNEAVRAKQRFRRALVSPVGPGADEVAARPEAQHEDGDDQRGRVDGVAEEVAELADPDDLIDEAANAGKEKEKKEHGARV